MAVLCVRMGWGKVLAKRRQVGKVARARWFLARRLTCCQNLCLPQKPCLVSVDATPKSMGEDHGKDRLQHEPIAGRLR